MDPLEVEPEVPAFAPGRPDLADGDVVVLRGFPAGLLGLVELGAPAAAPPGDLEPGATAVVNADAVAALAPGPPVLATRIRNLLHEPNRAVDRSLTLLVAAIDRCTAERDHLVRGQAGIVTEPLKAHVARPDLDEAAAVDDLSPRVLHAHVDPPAVLELPEVAGGKNAVAESPRFPLAVGLRRARRLRLSDR